MKWSGSIKSQKMEIQVSQNWIEVFEQMYIPSLSWRVVTSIVAILWPISHLLVTAQLTWHFEYQMEQESSQKNNSCCVHFMMYNRLHWWKCYCPISINDLKARKYVIFLLIITIHWTFSLLLSSLYQSTAAKSPEAHFCSACCAFLPCTL